jgi:NADP-dependent aldehyde dehydrogenase
MQLTGDLLIAGERVSKRERFEAQNPATGEMLTPAFSAGAPDDVDRACAAAAEAFPEFARDDERRARFLEAIADAIMALGDPLLERAAAESGLPLARLTGERGRTVGQLRLFAAEVRSRAWLGLRIDPALPDRQPLPRPDLRLRRIALGPVAVFGASNFPLAFSVAGGDTAAAFAAGCPVVVKGHPAHPGTSEMVGCAIADAATATGLPAGVFSLLTGPDHALGTALVADPRIKAVGFTGSRVGGLALMKVAQARPVPIPVFAEMSSINPVLLLPHALASRAETLATAFVGSLTLGAGQFCTNPGIVFAVAGDDLDRFVAVAAEALAAVPPATMLTAGIHQSYEQGVARLEALGPVRLAGRGAKGDGPARGRPALFEIDAEDFMADESVAQEIFGAASLIVRCRDAAQLRSAMSKLEGQLTATLHFDPADEPEVLRLIPLLEATAGRLIANGWPTGVEVSHAMIHGGPFPATSDGASTSVGTLAIDRFLRPVCYQDFPGSLLPEALRDGAQAGIVHRFDGTVRV